MRDFSGIKIGLWTVVSFHHKTSKQSYWNAKCSCGKEGILRDDVIRKQRSNSCISCRQRGKPSRSRIDNRAQVLVNTEYSMYKSQAKFHQREFQLSKVEFSKLIFSNCHYCLTTPNRIMSDKFSSETITINGVDRVNSDLGYTLQNCVPCCAICNRMKNALTIHEFKSHIVQINANLANF